MLSARVCVCNSMKRSCIRDSRRPQKTRERTPSASLLSDHARTETGSHRFNQTLVAYDATKEEKVDALKKENVVIEERLRDKQ